MTRNVSFSKKSFSEQLEGTRVALVALKNDRLNFELADRYAEEVNKCIDYLHRQALGGRSFSRVNKCRDAIISEYPSIGVMNDIADSSKHAGIDRPRYTIESVDIHQGSFSSAFDTERLIVIWANSENKVDFIKAAEKALNHIVNIANL